MIDNTADQRTAQKLEGYDYDGHAEGTKPWAECTAEQKLDRLRNELLQARTQSRWVNERFARIGNKQQLFEYHQHGVDGAVLVRPRDVERGYRVCTESIKGVFDPLA